MVPRGNLAGTTTTWAIAREAEAKIGLVRNKTRTAGKKHTLKKDEASYVNGEGMDVVNHQVGCSQGNSHQSHLAAYCYNTSVEHITNCTWQTCCRANHR